MGIGAYKGLVGKDEGRALDPVGKAPTCAIVDGVVGQCRGHGSAPQL